MSSTAPRLAPTVPALPITDLSLDPVPGLRRLVAALFLIDLALGLAYGVNYAIGAPWHAFSRAVDLDAEGNAATWYASTQWALAGLIFLVATLPRLDRKRLSTYALLVMTGVCFYCSLDETAQLHETFPPMPYPVCRLGETGCTCSPPLPPSSRAPASGRWR
jgi:hypothetical protein